VDKLRGDIDNHNARLYHPIPDATRERPIHGRDDLIIRKTTKRHYNIRHNLIKSYKLTYQHKYFYINI